MPKFLKIEVTLIGTETEIDDAMEKFAGNPTWARYEILEEGDTVEDSNGNTEIPDLAEDYPGQRISGPEDV